MNKDLDSRPGLPPELRVLADLYPRDAWRGHRNFSGLTAFWLDRHAMFREVMDRLIDETEGFLEGAEEARNYGARLSRYTGFFLEGLHGHHTIEDHHYFPQLAGLDARVLRAFDLLDADHHALDGHIHALAEATNAVLRPLSHGHDVSQAAGALLEAQGAFRHMLSRHLEDEEEIVVPLILEYGPDLQ